MILEMHTLKGTKRVSLSSGEEQYKTRIENLCFDQCYLRVIETSHSKVSNEQANI